VCYYNRENALVYIHIYIYYYVIYHKLRENTNDQSVVIYSLIIAVLQTTLTFSTHKDYRGFLKIENFTSAAERADNNMQNGVFAAQLARYVCIHIIH